MTKHKNNKFHNLLVSNLPKPESIIRKKEVCDLLGRSESTIDRWVKNNQMPKPVRHLNGRMIGWRRSEIEVYIRSL